MRNFTFLLAIFLLLLSVHPCGDTAEKDLGQSEMSHNHDHDHEHESHEICTPFCVCACCGSHIQLVSSFFIATPIVVKMPTENKLTYTSLYKSYHSNIILEPPIM